MNVAFCAKLAFISMENTLSALIKKHTNTLKDQGQTLIQALDAKPARLDEARALSHMLKGSSGSLGFRRFMELSLAIEQKCKAILAGDESTLDPETLDEFRDLIENLTHKDSELYQESAE